MEARLGRKEQRQAEGDGEMGGRFGRGRRWEEADKGAMIGFGRKVNVKLRDRKGKNTHEHALTHSSDDLAPVTVG